MVTWWNLTIVADLPGVGVGGVADRFGLRGREARVSGDDEELADRREAREAGSSACERGVVGDEDGEVGLGETREAVEARERGVVVDPEAVDGASEGRETLERREGRVVP